eukprot:Nk52_evm29s217 gene=Nk52_evmTU29s217
MTAATFNPANAESRSQMVTAIKYATSMGANQDANLKAVNSSKFGAVLEKAMKDKKSTENREAACAFFSELLNACGKHAEPIVVAHLDSVLDLIGDKQLKVRNAADATLQALAKNMNPNAIKIVLPKLLAGLDNDKKWMTKMSCLKTIMSMVEVHPFQMRACIPETLPVLSECMWDTKPEVQALCKDAMTATCNLVGNKDIEEFIPAVVSCIANPSEVPGCVHKLGATTFVTTVDQATLSVMVPLLIRAQTERATPIKRKTCVIVDNMCKLVEDPRDAALFLPKLLPGLDRIKEEVADPEVRDVATRAHNTLMKACNGLDPEKVTSHKKADPKELLDYIVSKVKGSGKIEGLVLSSLEFVANLCAQLSDSLHFCPKTWLNTAFDPYLEVFFPKATYEPVSHSLCKAEEEKARKDNVLGDEQEEEEGEDLCDCEFSLAYGGKILLNNARLVLKKGKRYGLCGPNGVGKSTLMRAIANGQLDGFPSPDEVKTCYVEHDIDGETAEMEVIDFILNDPDFSKLEKKEVKDTLNSVGFDEEMCHSPITSLSGGWKMKLALARAMLRHADILLLDEPTNHLDVVNVAWLEKYLTGLKSVTSIIVSHDSGFLDNVCTGIIHYESLKLKNYVGNLSVFVKKVPSAKSYYELASSQGLTWKFPEPGFLEGIKSKDKAILKMNGVGFSYPGTTKQILHDVAIQVSLSTRAAVIGPNGAGKSTMIKILTGELETEIGTIWRHPNMRFAYVAQHAFHHIEDHLDKSPNEYIQWRFAGGEDREELEKEGNKITAEELAEMQKVNIIDGVKRVVDKILGRRKLKNSYEYEVQWKNSAPDENMWLPRKQLMDMGLEKMILEIDRKVAAEQGNMLRPLTQKAIEKHLSDVGLDPEFATHSQMRGLSGGQKVKVVIGAAMWLNPHVLIMDEPTNYLDRESLGALAAAIREFNGGVLLISHNQQFTSELCDQVWTVNNGLLVPTGHNWTDTNAGEKIDWKEEEEMIDAFGNVVKNTRKKKLTKREIREKKKRNALRRKQGLPVSDDEDDDF